MSERLIIQSFAGIQELEIELKRINILIGPTASGKSICAKLCFYFKSFMEEIIESILQAQTWDDFLEKMQVKFTSFFSDSAWETIDSRVRYYIDNEFIEITCETKDQPKVHVSEQYIALFFNLTGIYQIEQKELHYPNQATEYISQKSNLFNYARRHFNFSAESTREQFFIPAGRSFFTNLEHNIFNIISAGTSLDPFLISFGQSYENSKNWMRKYGKFPYAQPPLLKTLISKVAAGEYCYVEKADCLQSPDGRIVELRRASSGQQEALPMLMILESLPGTSSMSGNRTIYIEEPEAHLFPETQRDIVHLIAVIFNISKIDLQFFITTHSPYILTAFNNLLQAGELYHQSMSTTESAQLERIVPKVMALKIDDISVYSLAHRQCTDLISHDLDLIDTNILDDISNQMSIEFGQLLDLAG